MARKAQNTTIVFVRHGVTPTTGKILPGRAKGLHLSDRGLDQADQVAAHLRDCGVEPAAVYASPLERTRETAKPIAKQFGLQTKAHKGFIECDFGDWTGQELLKLNKLKEWQGVLSTPEHFRFPNGESYLEMQARVRDAVEDVVSAHPDQTVVVVSHADPIKMVLCLALDATIRPMHHIDIAPCSMTTIRYGQMQQASVVRVNEISKTGVQG